VQALADLEGEPVVQRKRRRLCLSDQGDELRIESVYSGDLDRAWLSTHAKPKPSHGVLTIACNLAVSCNEKPEVLFWRGASVLKLTDALQTRGHAVGILAYSMLTDVAQTSANQRQVNLSLSVDIKAPDQPLDPSALASSLCFAGFFRNVFLPETANVCEDEKRGVGYGFGRPDREGSCFAEKALPLLPVSQTAILQPYSVRDQDSADAWTREVIASLESPEQATA
jgi:hypothetical protein